MNLTLNLIYLLCKRLVGCYCCDKLNDIIYWKIGKYLAADQIASSWNNIPGIRMEDGF